MDISALKDKLGDETFTELSTYVETLVGQRDAAKKESIDGRKQLKARVAELEASQTGLLEKLGLDSLEDLETLPDAKGQAEAAKQMEVKLKRLERQLADTAKERDDIAGRHRDAVKTASLTKALAGHDFVDRDVVEAFIAQKIEWEGDELLYRDGGHLVPVQDGIVSLLKAKPSLLKAPSAGGAGARSGAGGGGTRNPWSKDHYNLTEQGQMLRENPQLAAQMQEAAK